MSYAYTLAPPTPPSLNLFKQGVPNEKLFSPTYVAEQLLAVIADRTPEDSGSFWDWNGQPIEW
ncbi:hypothetical protein HSBAA_01370 [Vreelandella sulfidaeris]|uniref:Short-chain dehydrogenase n=1 Tax=Vreelandella sulfidaeris TaxID=115553 RepID=A0A455U2X7_9GAMM|nr:hypothetical protein HSBAA_01370 [Halomonas sulfidaeris]